MKINVYSRSKAVPVRLNKFVRNILEAQSFCDWYRRKFGEEVQYVICH